MAFVKTTHNKQFTEISLAMKGSAEYILLDTCIVSNSVSSDLIVHLIKIILFLQCIL